MKVKTVPSTWLEQEGRRLDCGPYLSGAIEAKVLLDRLPVKKEPLAVLTVGGKSGIYHAGREGRTYVTDPTHGVPFLGSSSILAADLSWLPLLSKRQVAGNPQLIIQSGWILISRSGTTGRMVYSRADMAGMACSEDVLRVVPDSTKILPGYLYAYLSSRFGVPLVTSRTYGAVVQHIEPQHIADLPVPIASDGLQRSTHELITESARLRTQASQRYSSGTAMLFAATGAKEPVRHTWLSSTKSRSFVTTSVSASSLRALNYDPRYLELCENLKVGRHNPLGSLCDPQHFKSGIIFKRIDADEQYSVRLVGQRGAFQVRPEGRWISKKSIEGLGLLVPSGTTLIAAHGTMGETELYCRSHYVTKRTSDYAFSGDFVRCVPLRDKVLPGFLFAFLRSETAFRILRSISIGSKQQAHHPDLLWNIPVPRIEDALEHQIHELIEQSADDFDRALQLEEEAWSLIENWITEGA
jgi:hypothetical protein